MRFSSVLLSSCGKRTAGEKATARRRLRKEAARLPRFSKRSDSIPRLIYRFAFCVFRARGKNIPLCSWRASSQPSFLFNFLFHSVSILIRGFFYLFLAVGSCYIRVYVIYISIFSCVLFLLSIFLSELPQIGR